MAQLKALHPHNSETSINNTGVLQWLDAGDLDGSRYVSDLCGKTEVYGNSKLLTFDPQDEDRLDVNESRSQTARPLAQREHEGLRRARRFNRVSK